jgi:hypothetical protein
MLWAELARARGSQADDTVKLVLTLKNHLFQPAEIKVPTGEPVEILIRNEDATPEEFESSSLKLEKIVAGKSEGVVRIKSLKAGRYEFIGEYGGLAYCWDNRHPETRTLGPEDGGGERTALFWLRLARIRGGIFNATNRRQPAPPSGQSARSLALRRSKPSSRSSIRSDAQNASV